MQNTYNNDFIKSHNSDFDLNPNMVGYKPSTDIFMNKLKRKSSRNNVELSFGDD